MNDPVFLELFNRLQRAGLDLGLGEYHLLLKALDGGFGTQNRDALFQLCCTLWIKSDEEEQTFKECFDQLISEKSVGKILQTLPTISIPKPSSPKVFAKEIEPKKQSIFKIYRYLSLGMAACLMLTGGIWSVMKLRSSDSKKIPENTLNFSSNLLGQSRFIFREDHDQPLIEIERSGNHNSTIHATIKIELEFPPVGIAKEKHEEQILEDFHNTHIPIIFESHLNLKSFKIPIKNDNEFELDERFILTLVKPEGGAKIGINNTAVLLIRDDDPNPIGNSPQYQVLQEILEWFCIVIVVAVIIRIFFVTHSLSERVAASDNETAEGYTDLSKTNLSPKVIQNMADTIQVAKAIKQAETLLEMSVSLNVRDSPVTFRQMKQGWRYMRNLVREGIPTELDLQATVQQISQQGFLICPILTPRRKNQLSLMLLIDRDGSMVPFHHLSQGLIRTACQGGRFNQVHIYYFHNCPSDYLHEDPYHLKAVSVETCLEQLSGERMVCLIFSDAGAARGGLNARRRRRTKFFLKQLQEFIACTVWLNPVPRNRWQNTTAANIANFVPMFATNPQDFYRAIDALRGRYHISENAQRNLKNQGF